MRVTALLIDAAAGRGSAVVSSCVCRAIKEVAFVDRPSVTSNTVDELL